MRRFALLLALFVAMLACGAVGARASITFPDLSNNDPTYNMGAIKRHGHPGVVLKTNQGVGFIDSTFYYMAKAAQRVGLAVGGYDFDQEYTAAEAYVFVNRLHAAGITRWSPRKFPPTLDIEFGVPSRAGVEHQLAVLNREFGRAQIYTGAWYWLPHFGCWVPPHVTFWLSGYPYAALLCGLSDHWFGVHQYTDHGFNGVFSADMNVWRGSAASFAAYIQNQPRAHIEPRKQQAILRYAKHLRTILRREIAAHGGSHGPPKPPHYRRVWLYWIHEGRAVNLQIKRLNHEGVR